MGSGFFRVNSLSEGTSRRFENAVPPICPTCDDDLANRLDDRCPECGTIWSATALARIRKANSKQRRIDAVGYGCLTGLCLFVDTVLVVMAIDYGALSLAGVSLAVLLLACVFGHRLCHRVRRWNDE